ncbi:hypothetical protein [Tenacibaculum halocynthiae]|uniref:hypothetical protein n=1 Tax=Tenacibaculum halocynthiae TaxID=1254437 RepID=UPI003D6553AA
MKSTIQEILINRILKTFNVNVFVGEVFIKISMRKIADYIITIKQMEFTSESDVKQYQQLF